VTRTSSSGIRLTDGWFGKLPGRRYWPVLLLCVFLAGCSATRVVYNQLDWILVWYINDFFTLDNEQEDWLEAAVERNMEWHRRDQLPEYARLLREIEQDISSRVMTPDRLERHYARIIVLWDEFIVQTMPDVTVFFLSLSQEQVDEFIENLKESNQELWDKYAGQTPEERQKNRQEGAVKAIGRIFGRLSDKQKHLIRSYQASLHDVSDEWMAGRRQWQRDFRDLVIERPPEPEFSNRMIRLVLDPNENDPPDYRHLVVENRRTMMSMMAALIAGLSDTQRERFSKRLKKYARNFEILAAQET